MNAASYAYKTIVSMEREGTHELPPLTGELLMDCLRVWVCGSTPVHI